MDTAEQDPVLVVAAEQRELKGVLRRCRRMERLRWETDFAARAELNGIRLLLAANGPGPGLAAQAAGTALEKERVRAVISAGSCGALDPELAPGDIFVASEVRCPDSGRKFFTCQPHCPRAYRKGVLLSLDRVICSAVEKAELRRSGAAAVEMEAAGVACRAGERDLPFYAIRAVLDTARESFRLDFNALRCAAGRFSRARLLRATLRDPLAAGPELLRLRRNLGLAAEKLGEFLADCRF